jgi:hypothetical protein
MELQILLIIALAVLLVNAIYTRLSGRDFLRDNATRLRLAVCPVERWHRFWERNPRTSSVVICMTSTPSRLPLIGATLKSLLAQTVRAQQIRLYIPDWSRRDRRLYEIPDWLRALPAVEIVRCDDRGPATKLLFALRDSAPEQLLLAVDDDMIYPPTLVEDHFARALEHPDVAICSSGWIVPRDLTDRPTTLLSHLFGRAPAPLFGTRTRDPVRIDVMQGYTGYLVRPRFFAPETVSAHAAAPDSAFYVDDVWFSAQCAAAKYVFPLQRICFDRWRDYGFFKANSLGLLNRGGGDPERRNNTIMIRHFADRWLNARGRDTRVES